MLAGRNIRLIGSEGNQLGIVPFQKGIDLAKQAGLNLVLVAGNAEPPVCKIIDFGKLIYEQKKKDKDQKRHQHAQKHKEVKFTSNIDPHDYQIKVSHTVEFLKKNYKVKATMIFRGREMAHKELGFDIMERLVKDVAGHGVPEAPPKLMGRNIIVSFSPSVK